MKRQDLDIILRQLFSIIVMTSTVCLLTSCGEGYKVKSTLSSQSSGPEEPAPPQEPPQDPPLEPPQNPPQDPPLEPPQNPPTIPTGNQYLPDPVVTGKTMVVCNKLSDDSSCQYTLLSSAMAAAADGDLILVRPGTYNDCTNVDKNNLTIRGVLDGSGNRPHFANKVCGQKGIFVIKAANVLVENIELSGAIDNVNSDKNWAGIRGDGGSSPAKNLKVRNCYFHDSDNGILYGSAVAGNIVVVESSVFEKLGRAGYAHGMYISGRIDHFVLRNSVVTNNHDDGHLVKSRALKTTIECNTIASLNGENSYAIDFPDGGTAIVRSNVVEQGPNINNSGNYFLRFGEESGKSSPHSVQLTENYFVNDYSKDGQITISQGATTDGWSNNKYAGNGTLKVTGYVGSDSITILGSRATAGLPAYNGSTSSLPTPPVCP